MSRLTEDKISAINQLRRHGHSIPEISRKLDIPKSTIHRHAKSVKILPEHLLRLRDLQRTSKLVYDRHWIEANKFARGAFNTITHKELLLMTATLYWAEGAKKDLSFSNTDPVMIRVFVQSMRNLFSLSDEDFKISIRLFDDLDQQKCVDFWAKIAGIATENSPIKVNILRGKKVGKLKYGMCRIRIRRGGYILKRLFAVINYSSFLIQKQLRLPIVQRTERENPNL